MKELGPHYERIGNCHQCGRCCENEECLFLGHREGKAICEIHEDKNRPGKCGRFPQAPPIMIEECGYRFKDLWEGRTLEVKEI